MAMAMATATATATANTSSSSPPVVVAVPSLLHKLNQSSPPLVAFHPPTKPQSTLTSRRSSSIILITTILLSTKPTPAAALEFRMTVPDQTLEEAEAGIQSHARSLLGVKDLLMAEESWKEAQKLLRKSSSLLKQDIYTIIQAKPPAQRPHLRKLYSDLFNAVTRLDYAARDKDTVLVWESYNAIVIALDHIFSTL